MVTKKKQVGFQVLLLLATLALAVTGCKPPGVRALLTGKRLLDSGKTTAALEPLQKATLLLPSNAHAWNYLGLAYHANNLPVEAANAYQKALGLNPNLVEVHYSLGCLLLEQGNPTSAKNELTTYTLSRPKDINGWLRLASAQWRSRELATAEKSYAEVLKLDSKNPEALNNLGMVQLSRNRAADAQTYFAAAVRVAPDYAPALLNLALVKHQYLGNRRGALEAYRDYLALKPTPANSEAVSNVATALEAELNPPKPAVVVVAPKPVAPPPVLLKPTPPGRVASNNISPKPVVIAPPKTTNPTVVVAVTQPTPAADVNQPPEKETANQSNHMVISTPLPAANVTPPLIILPLTNLPPGPVATNPPVQIMIVSNVPVRVTGSDAPPKPLPAAPRSFPRYNFRYIPKPKPGNRGEADKFLGVGLDAQKDGRLTDALAAFRSAAQADPAYFKAAYNQAWAAYALKDWPTALEAYETALAIEPESPDARYNFALTLKQANYPIDSARELERLLLKRPDDPSAHLLLANLYAQQLSDPHLARPHYMKVLELNPRHPQATLIRYWLSENLQ